MSLRLRVLGVAVIVLVFGALAVLGIPWSRPKHHGTRVNGFGVEIVMAQMAEDVNPAAWPNAELKELYTSFDESLARGRTGIRDLMVALDYNVCLSVLEAMMAEYEYAPDITGVTPAQVFNEARSNFWSRFQTLETLRPNSMEGRPMMPRLELYRRYGFLANQSVS